MADEELPHYLPDFPATTEPIADFVEEAESPIATSASTSAPSESAPYSSPLYTPAPSVVAAPQEAPLANSDREGSAQGWKGSNAALTVVRGLEGQALRVTRKGNRETFAFYPAKRLVSKKAGAPYKVRAYVRTKSPGMYLCLRVQEFTGGTPKTTERCAPARDGWRRVALKGKTAGKGHKLVFSIHVMAALGGTSFDVDGFKLG